MKLDRKDRNVFGLAILAAAVFVTTYAGWGVPLIGDSHRWATAVILVLGLAAGALSAPGLESRSYLEAGLVVLGFLFAVLAFATASLAAVALLAWPSSRSSPRRLPGTCAMGARRRSQPDSHP